MMILRNINKYLFASMVCCGLALVFTACEDKLDEDPDSRWIKIDTAEKNT